MTVDQNQIQPSGEVVSPQEAVNNVIQTESPVVETPTETANTVPDTASAPEAIQAATPESATAGVELTGNNVAAPAAPVVKDQAQAPLADDAVAAGNAQVQTNPVTSSAVDDTAAFPGDDVYIREVNRVIKEDAEKPYEEEEDSEMIQKDYLWKRFGVKTDMDKE